MSRFVSFAVLLSLMSTPCVGQSWPPWANEAFGMQPTWRYESPRRALEPRIDSHDGGPRPLITPQLPPIVVFHHSFPPKSIVIDTPGRKLYYVLGDHQAFAYPISVGRDGFRWTGTETISRKHAWPDWHPPEEMRQRDPKLPEKMTGGVRNPLGAMALYLGTTLYRIHGTNDAKSIGQAQSSGCFRMMNAAVLHLAELAEIGTTVAVVSSLPALPRVARTSAPAAQPLLPRAEARYSNE